MSPKAVQFEEIYLCAVLSTAYLTEADKAELSRMAAAHDATMVFERETGFLIKLYEESEYLESECAGLSPYALDALRAAHALGIRLVEFDADGPEVGGLVQPS